MALHLQQQESAILNIYNNDLSLKTKAEKKNLRL